MSGLYIHIPFCKSRCIYCGFYSTTALSLMEKYIDAVCEEIRIRQNYLSSPISTIYLGGGTPSQLSIKQIDKIFNTIYKYNKVASDICTNGEITMECNPDDITTDFADFIRKSDINRISMGAQTFSNDILKFIRRRHTAGQVKEAVSRLRNAGIGNISVDLMFGFPGEDIKQWQSDLDEAIKLDVEHISAYSLMYEEETYLYRLLESGKIRECDEETSLTMYNMLIDTLKDAGYEHYEISNFAKPGFKSKHNSSYWHGVPYLGIGASAHSFNTASRQWNVDDIKEYIENISKGIVPEEHEILTKDTAFDECVMTGLRTAEGINLERVEEKFGTEYLKDLKREAEKHINKGFLKYDNQSTRLSLTREGLFISDTIMSDLMHVN